MSSKNKLMRLPKERLDPVTFEIIKNAFFSVTNEMGGLIKRASYSMVLNEAADLSAALLDSEGNLVVHGKYDMPLFGPVQQLAAKAAIQKLGPDGFEAGDMIISNDMYLGNTHFNDVVLIKPVFFDSKMIGFLSSMGHWPDVGGRVPGSFAPDSVEYYEEGIRIPMVKIVEKGKLNQSLYDMILGNIRVPQESKGDVNAQMSANRRGEQRLFELIEKYGVDIILASMQEVMNQSLEAFRKRILDLKSGSYEWEDHMDRLPDTTNKRIRLSLEIRNGHVTFDFTGTDHQSKYAMNQTYSTTVAMAATITNAIYPEIVLNGGFLKPMNFIIPEGTILNVKPPTAISGMASTTLQKVEAVVLGCFSKVVPGRVCACPYNTTNTVIGGYDPIRSRRYIDYFWSEGGEGGRATCDGEQGVLQLLASAARVQPVEVAERKDPVLFVNWGFWNDSAGAGKFRGGLGATRIIKIDRGEARLTALGDRKEYPCWGLFGGKSAPPNSIKINGRTHGLRFSGYLLKEGDLIEFACAGGGGYGNPLERDPELVLEDVLDEFVSMKSARNMYGVVISSKTMSLDPRATQKLRKKMKRKRS